MSVQIILVLLLIFIINLISTLSYSVRIVGIHTRKIAAVMQFSVEKSVPKSLLHAFSKIGIRQIMAEVKLPEKGN
jgi:hypothetical protein